MEIERLLKNLASSFSSDIRIISAYLSGSYAKGYFIKGVSDIDILIICKEEDDAQEIARKISATYVEIDLDISCLSYKKIFEVKTNPIVRETVLASKLAGRCIYGKDILKDWAVPSYEDYLSGTITQTMVMICRARNEMTLTYPLTYPQKEKKYKGYINVREGELSTKLLVSIYTWIATSYLAVQGIYCGCKNDCIQFCKQYLPNDFSKSVIDVYDWCRGVWHYHVPETTLEQEHLIQFCNDVLNYENKFIKKWGKV